MKLRVLGRIWGIAGGVLLAGCGHPTEPSPSAGQRGENPEIVEGARRDERLKIMQEYWYEHAIAADPSQRLGANGPAVFLYPAGNYQGINFSGRQAPDSSLAEPLR